MNILPIDFETHYSKEFSLSKMTTEAYIRDPRFEVIGVSVRDGDNTRWFSGTMDETRDWLQQFPWESSAMLAHNAAFDGAILAWHFGITPRFYLDTLSMARPAHKLTVGGSLAALVSYYKLGEKGTEVVNALGKRRRDFTPEQLAAYGRYCINDTNLTHALFNKLKAGFPASELMVIDQTMRMYTNPVVELDATLLQQHLDEVKAKKQELLGEVASNASVEDIKKMLMSNPKFAQLLESLGVDPPLKKSLTTGRLTYAFAKTDRAMTDLLEHPDERVQTVVAARMGVKSTIEESRTEALLGVAERGRLPIMLNYYGAHTGRFSGGDKLNLQNLPKRKNTAIRNALLPPEGHSFIVCDLAQIEARLLAYVAGQADLVDAFREGRDVYCEFASEIYGRTITADDKTERFVGKTAILSLGYGAGADKFQAMLRIQGNVKIDNNEAHQIVQLYRNKNHKIVSFWSHCGYALTSMCNGNSGNINDLLAYSPEGIRLPSGFFINYPLLRPTRDGYMYTNNPGAYRKVIKNRVLGNSVEAIQWVKIYGGKCSENLVQALAAQLIREQMSRVGVLYRVAFQVHDEIIAVVPDAEVEEAEYKIMAHMSQPPVWAPDLPVACESNVWKNYGGV